MKKSDTKIAIGGVLRCCFSGLDDIMPDDDVVTGQRAPCKYCKDREGSGMILDGKIWRGAWVVQERNQTATKDQPHAH